MFQNCKDKEEAKKLYRRLCLRLHPDAGGEDDLMILLQHSYQSFIENPEIPKKSEEYFNKNDQKYCRTYEDVSVLEEDMLKIIDEILEYSKKHKRFDPSFVRSVTGFLYENGYITSNQYNSLVKLYYSFRMDMEPSPKQP